MIEIIPSVWISPNAKIDSKVLFGKNVTIYGNTTICENTIIEDNVTIGHPSPSEVESLFSRNNNKMWKRDLFTAYNSISTKNTHIGKNSIIRSNTVIYNGNYIDDFFDCGHNVIIREDCKISKYCYFFSHTQIKRAAVIGQSCRIAGTICDRTKIGAYSSVFGHTVHENTSGVGGKIEKAPTIGEGVLIGRETVIIGDVSIGDFSSIATNSTVSKDINSFTVASGPPAKCIGKRSNEEVSDIFTKMKGDGYEHKAC